jgi:hypothetical protein
MENKEVKITIDQNGNIYREDIDQSQSKVRKPRFIKRLTLFH